jgi:hypothetical protein
VLFLVSSSPENRFLMSVLFYSGPQSEMKNPFQDDIFSDETGVIHVGDGNVTSIHDRVLRRLSSEIAEASATGLELAVGARGGTILLTAPRAGYGKTHLLARLRASLESESTVVAAHFNLEETPAWATLLRQTLDAFRTIEPGGAIGSSPPARIQTLARKVFGTITARLIEIGEVPSAHPESAASGLAHNSLSLFAPTSDDQSARDWLTNNFEELRPAMARLLAKARGASESGAAYWLDILKEANDCPLEELADFLGASVPDSPAGGSDSRIAKRRLDDFCRIATLHRPVVFIFDHLDCFHGDIREGLRIAYLLSELRELSPGQIAILAANDDLWQSAFGNRLPSALADRLTSIPNRLGVLPPDDARDLIVSRCHAAGLSDEATTRFIAGFDLGRGDDLSPRAILRRARAAWDRFAGYESPEPASPVIDAMPKPIAEGFPSGLLGEFGTDIPSVAELMDAETLRRSKAKAAQDDDDPFPSAGISPFLSDPEDSYINGPYSLHSILKSVPPAETPESGNGLPALKKTGDLLASLRGGKTPPPTLYAPPTPSDSVRIPPPKAPQRANGSTTTANGGTALRHPVLTRFERIRESLIDPGDSTLSPARLLSLVSHCGNQSPFIDSTEIFLPGNPDGHVIRWNLPDQKILFAFAEPDATTFWRAFFQLATEDTDQGAALKLVAFAPSGSAFPDSKPLDTRAIPARARQALDVVTLLPETLATLRAAAETIADSEAIAPATPGEALGILSDELDFFWRRLTRPLTPVAG